MKRLFFICMIFIALIAKTVFATPLPANDAFQFSATAKDYQTILVQFKIAKNDYLYKDHFQFTVLSPKDVQLGNPLYPSGVQTLNTSLGDFLVYANNLTIPIPIINATASHVILRVQYQGCSKAGYCYPPTHKIVSINLSGNYFQPAQALHIDLAPTQNTTPPENRFEKLLSGHSFLLKIAGFFVFGVLLSLTPCVLPMIPILSSIIVGREKKHAFLLSVFYMMGMAITYAIAGILFGFIGHSVQAIFQKTWVITLFSLIFIVMALSLFGLFELQLPEKFRAKIAEKSYHQKSGTYIGAFLMGVLSTLILSPCVTPPLVAVLGFISQSGNIVLGGSALFFMAIGMGLPLLLIGAIGPSVLPKSGKWMQWIKVFLGILLLAVAFTMLERILPHDNKSNLPFQSVTSVSDVQKALASARSNQIVLLDFYADWCIACKELDASTFQNKAVQEKLKQMVLLRADVTANSADDQLLEKEYGVIAPPTILFFKNGKEIVGSRVIGYQPPEQFLNQYIARLQDAKFF